VICCADVQKDPGLFTRSSSGWWVEKEIQQRTRLASSVCMYVCMYVYITINTYISQADFLPKQRQSLDNREKIKRGTKEKLVE
jgi:spermidine synthase